MKGFDRPFSDQISNLQRAVQECPWRSHMELLFRILYGLPASVTIGIAIESLWRFLPAFQFRWPRHNWPIRILNDPYEWVRRHGWSIGSVPKYGGLKYGAYVAGFDALVNAIVYQDDQGCMASSSCVVISCARSAIVDNVWEADDPDAVRLWRISRLPPGRSAIENVASLAVARREWEVLIEFLSTEENARIFDSGRVNEVEAYLARWRGSGDEFFLTGPFPANEEDDELGRWENIRRHARRQGPTNSF